MIYTITAMHHTRHKVDTKIVWSMAFPQPYTEIPFLITILDYTLQKHKYYKTTTLHLPITKRFCHEHHVSECNRTSITILYTNNQNESEYASESTANQNLNILPRNEWQLNTECACASVYS